MNQINPVNDDIKFQQVMQKYYINTLLSHHLGIIKDMCKKDRIQNEFNRLFNVRYIKR
jgi:hypothetical protein